MIIKKNKKLGRRSGQGMTEYIIIVGLIAILLVAAVGRFKTALEGAFDAGTNEINTKITSQIGSGQ
ncbi:MAG: hypothetical protein KF878_30900 [Planctomycetes bacterium]|nr:hypothetical protein [Planctomycetota bacterium]MCW8140229.1 hypothetical protein [Planctomycetota bacterium]